MNNKVFLWTQHLALAVCLHELTFVLKRLACLIKIYIG